jgi:glycine/D-amino acid oxidase-like deaminating enzyme
MFPIPTYYRHGYEYWQQTANGCIALGGFRDIGGENEWTQSVQPSSKIQRRLDEFLYEELSVPRHVRVTHRWAAGVAFTNDGIPLIREVRPNVYVSGAYSGTGNTMSTLSGTAVAHLALGHTNTWARLLDEARVAVISKGKSA